VTQQVEPSPPCPTPKKARFATMEAALDAARRASFALNKSLYPYDTCPCGWVHLTSKTRNAVAADAPSVLTDGVDLDQDEFMLLVRNEVVGRCSPQDAEKLRSRLYLVRWSDALKAFQIDISAQLAERAGMRDEESVAWRKRLANVQRSLALRRAEVKQLLRSYYSSSGEVVAQIAHGERKELRRIAGERAVLRLKKAHHEEFGRYLAEEFKNAGLPVSENLARCLSMETEGDNGDHTEESAGENG
jgi:hypothetical protein